MNIAVLGCGNMGRAIIAGLYGKHGRNVNITVYDKSRAALDALPEHVTSTVTEPSQWFSNPCTPDIVIIAVKPQDIDSALRELVSHFKAPADIDVLWLSIAAGVSIAKLEAALGTAMRICRAMPNTPALLGEAASAYALNARADESDAEKAEFVLGAIGTANRVPEKLLNAVTGLSGSGPAYVYLFIEALIEAGVTSGLAPDIAKQCAVQTVLGAAKMVQQADESPAELKARVMSPGGTTVAGLVQLEKHGFKYAVIQAVTAATKRAAELGA